MSSFWHVTLHKNSMSWLVVFDWKHHPNTAQILAQCAVCRPFLDEIDWALLPKSANLRCHPVQLSPQIAKNSLGQATRKASKYVEETCANFHSKEFSILFVDLVVALMNQVQPWLGQSRPSIETYSRLLKTSSFCTLDWQMHVKFNPAQCLMPRWLLKGQH